MLVGSLGRVWAKTRMARNVYSSISIVAYFQLMESFDKPYHKNENLHIAERPDWGKIREERHRASALRRESQKLSNDHY
jgi:hypothetical protein